MSRNKIEISTGIPGIAAGGLGEAISRLRRCLDLTQFQMASRLGTRERNIQRWESGEAIPGGDWLIKMMHLCPDAESLAAFGIVAAPPPPREDGYYKLREDLELVINSGQSQLIGMAEETLDRLAEGARHMTQKRKSKRSGERKER